MLPLLVVAILIIGSLAFLLLGFAIRLTKLLCIGIEIFGLAPVLAKVLVLAR